MRWVHARDEIVRVALAALIGTFLAWVTYELVFWVNPMEPRATTSWALAFFIGIFRQHHLHRTISFPKSAVSYGVSLRRDFAASIGVALLSTALNYLLSEVLQSHHRVAWFGCVAFVAGFEYLVMKLYVFPRGRSHELRPPRG